MLFVSTIVAAIVLALIFAAAVNGYERTGKDRLANELLLGYTDA